MSVANFIKQVADSELRQLALSNVGEVTTAANEEQARNVATLVGYVNLGLVELYRRFPLKVEIYEDLFREPTEIDDPVKLPDTAISLDKVTTKDLVQIAVDDADAERKFVDKVYDKLFVKTLAVNTFIVNGVFKEPTTLYFHYKALPKAVSARDKLPIPVVYNEALLNYVAYRAYASMRSNTPVGDDASMYKKRFEDSCTQLAASTASLYDDYDVNRLHSKGFV